MKPDLDAVLGAVADRSRRVILQRLAQGPATSGQLADLLPMSRPAVSQHLKVLQETGLVHTEVRGRHRWHELSPGPLRAVERWAADLSARYAAIQEEP